MHHLETVIEILRTLDVHRTPQRVYEYLIDPDRIVQYVGPIKRIHRLTTPVVEAGTRLSVDARFLGIAFSQRCECTVYDPPRHFEARSVGGRFYFEAGFTLHRTRGGTRMEAWGKAAAPSLFRLAEALLGFLIARQIDSDLERIQRELEALGARGDI